MASFPVSSSILSPAHLAHFAQDLYGFDGTPQCRLLKAGINHSYLVDDGRRRLVLRIYSHRWRTEDEIMEEVRLVNHLNEAGIPVSHPVADVYGRYVQKFDAPEGIRHAVMFSFAEGHKQLTFSEALHERCGRVMASLHAATENFRLGRAHYTAEALTSKTLEGMARFVSLSGEEAVYVKRASAMVARTFASADASQVRTGAVHLDFWFDNMHFSGEEEVALFDFDFCGNGPLCLDIGYYWMQLFNTERDEARFAAKSEAFFRGYTAVCPIADEERRLLPAAGLAVFLFYLGVQCARFDDFSSTFMGEIHIQRFVRLILMKWAEFHGLD